MIFTNEKSAFPVISVFSCAWDCLGRLAAVGGFFDCGLEAWVALGGLGCLCRATAAAALPGLIPRFFLNRPSSPSSSPSSSLDCLPDCRRRFSKTLGGSFGGGGSYIFMSMANRITSSLSVKKQPSPQYAMPSGRNSAGISAWLCFLKYSIFSRGAIFFILDTSLYKSMATPGIRALVKCEPKGVLMSSQLWGSSCSIEKTWPN